MLDIIFGIILLVAAVFLIIAVLMQSGKAEGLSGTIAGGAETFFGKTKGKTIDKMLSKLTTIVAIVFTVLVIVVYVIQDDSDLDALYEDYQSSLTTTTAADDEDIDIPTGDDTTASENGETTDAEEDAEVTTSDSGEEPNAE